MYQARLAALASHHQQQQLPKPSPQTFRLPNQQLQNITESSINNPGEEEEEEAIILSKEEDIEESSGDELDDQDVVVRPFYSSFIFVLLSDRTVVMLDNLVSLFSKINIE